MHSALAVPGHDSHFVYSMIECGAQILATPNGNLKPR
jgi:hypothetical protein